MPTRKIRAGRAGLGRRGTDVSIAGRHPPLGRRTVEQAVRTVLEGEGREVSISVTFVGRDRMRRLNAAWKRKDRPTDVLAFSLPAPAGDLAGDVYVCRAVAVDHAAALAISAREELLRLVIHGTLHVLGYDHPDGVRRTRSVMWRRQERYLACVV